jgi:hypothetical protein
MNTKTTCNTKADVNFPAQAEVRRPHPDPIKRMVIQRSNSISNSKAKCTCGQEKCYESCTSGGQLDADLIAISRVRFERANTLAAIPRALNSYLVKTYRDRLGRLRHDNQYTPSGLVRKKVLSCHLLHGCGCGSRRSVRCGGPLEEGKPPVCRDRRVMASSACCYDIHCTGCRLPLSRIALHECRRDTLGIALARSGNQR